LKIHDENIKSVIQSFKRIPIDIYGNNTLLEYDLGFNISDKEILIDEMIKEFGADLNYNDVCRMNTIEDVIKLVNKRV